MPPRRNGQGRADPGSAARPRATPATAGSIRLRGATAADQVRLITAMNTEIDQLSEVVAAHSDDELPGALPVAVEAMGGRSFTCTLIPLSAATKRAGSVPEPHLPQGLTASTVQCWTNRLRTRHAPQVSTSLQPPSCTRS